MIQAQQRKPRAESERGYEDSKYFVIMRHAKMLCPCHGPCLWTVLCPVQLSE